jgi:hypothetical protein
VGASGGVGAVGVAQPGLVIIVSNLNKTVRFFWRELLALCCDQVISHSFYFWTSIVCNLYIICT